MIYNVKYPKILSKGYLCVFYKNICMSVCHTTQKGVAIKKIFELRAENRTECSLGW